MKTEYRSIPAPGRYRHSALLAVLLAFVLVACGPKSVNQPPEEETPDPTTTGSISIVINGLAGGAAADVSVTGPDSFSADVTVSGELTGLEAGTYTVTASPVTGYNLVGEAVLDVEVKVGEVTDVAVTYTTEPVGSLTITVEGLSGILADIKVTGPAYTTTVTKSRTLQNLPVGTYSVEVGSVPGHVLTGASSFDIEIEDGKEAAAAVVYAAADLAVSSAVASPELPLHTAMNLQFDIVRSGVFAGDVSYEVVGADGFLVQSWNGVVAAADDYFTITVTDDQAVLGSHTLTVSVSGSVHGQTLEQTIEVDLNLVAMVTTAGDDAMAPDLGSLRALLEDERTAGATITFAQNLFVSSELNIMLAAPLEFVKDVSIAGPTGWSSSPGPTVYLNGNLAFTPVIVTDGVSVTLANVQVHEGSAVNGGGIRVEAGGSLTLDGVFVFDNVASGNGGGIWSQGTLNVRNDSRIGQNEANHGGGVWTSHADAVTVLENSIVSFNDATVRGGGLYLGEGRLTLRAMGVRLNEAGQNGGGVIADNNGFQFERAWLEILDGTEVTGNRARNGAGIFNYAEATISDSLVHLNKATEDGGGIRNHLRMEISDTEVSENEAANDYGGVFSDGILTISDSLIRDNTAGGNGGGVVNGSVQYVQYDDLNGEAKRLLIERSQVVSNTAGFDGGTGNGGGIYSVGELEIIDSGINNNSALNGYGGGIYSISISHPSATHANSGELSISGSTISNNTASLEGGGLYTDSQYEGGAVDAPSTSLTILNSTLTGNQGLTGGGIYMWGLNDGPVNIAFSTIAENDAIGGTGGGIVNGRENVILRGNIVALNTSTALPGDRDIDSGKHMTSDGYNLLSSLPHANVGLGGTDMLSVTAASLNLQTLADNGGPTRTRAIAAASPAAGSVPVAQCLAPDGTTLTTDQRGTARPGNSGFCSRGSFEVQDTD